MSTGQRWEVEFTYSILIMASGLNKSKCMEREEDLQNFGLRFCKIIFFMGDDELLSRPGIVMVINAPVLSLSWLAPLVNSVATSYDPVKFCTFVC